MKLHSRNHLCDLPKSSEALPGFLGTLPQLKHHMEHALTGKTPPWSAALSDAESSQRSIQWDSSCEDFANDEVENQRTAATPPDLSSHTPLP